eukprot:SAG22_NODE_1584_length_4060_cov_81.610452_8_plen_103_part_00
MRGARVYHIVCPRSGCLDHRPCVLQASNRTHQGVEPAAPDRDREHDHQHLLVVLGEGVLQRVRRRHVVADQLGLGLGELRRLLEPLPELHPEDADQEADHVA